MELPNLQEIFSIEQFVRSEPLIAFDHRRRGVEPRALDDAAHVADRHPHPGGISNALDLPRIGFRIHVERVLVQHKPHRRLHALAVLLERFQRQVVLAAELCEFRSGTLLLRAAPGVDDDVVERQNASASPSAEWYTCAFSAYVRGCS